MRKLFGTDGIRGVAGEFPLDRETVFAIGRALGRRLVAGEGARRGKASAVLGQDTRESSAWIADRLGAGLSSAGVAVESAGVLPTPGVAYLARAKEYSAGIVISASHNPWIDNGIKIFGRDGYKLADAVELEIEREIFAELARRGGGGEQPAREAARRGGSLPGQAELRRAYVEWLEKQVKPGGGGLAIVVDCANGAASELATAVFQPCAGKTHMTHSQPSGRNINEQCGALHPEVVAREVAERKADLGIAFDGDADRCLFADANGQVVNGDAVLLLAARALQAQGALKTDTVVATTMSNMGLESALRREGIRMLRAPVGDKYVLEEMQKTGATLGGEQSGHILFLDRATTGDGLLTALVVLGTVAAAGRPLHELIADLKVFPQTIRNVRVREKKPLAEVPEVAAAIGAAERELDGNGRVVVRYSGTEALCRVMVEAESEALMRRHAEAIARAVEEALGA